MIEERIVHSWNDLQACLYDIPTTKHGRHRSNYVYRGMDKASWGLDTSLQRIGAHAASVERSMLRNFLKYAGREVSPTDSFLYKLAVAQHHGLPTRVLDWSTAPKVAVHFATGDEQLFHEDGVIWCVDVAAAREFLPERLRALLSKHDAFVFAIELLDDLKDLGAFDEEAGGEEFVLFFEPPSLDGRIINQGAMLSLMPGPALNLAMFLDKPERHRLARRIIVPAALKWEIRDKLDQDNISERMLFPGLDGTAKWLKRYYGAGPNRPPPTP